MEIGPYLPLFDFEVEHAFFPDGRCAANALRFVLTPESAQRLQRSGFVTRASDTGVAVFADSARMEVLRMIAGEAEEPFRLTWLAHAVDPEFGRYTAGLVYPPEGLPVFDSESAVADGTPGRWRLQREAYVSAADALAVDDERVAGVLAKQPVAPLFAVTLRLGAMGHAGSDAEVHAAGTSAATTAQGARTRDTDLAPQPRHYVLRFATREVVWKYWLIGAWRDAEPQVVDPDGATTFLQAQEATLPDGRSALTIRSADPIAIFRRSPYRFQLRGRVGSGERVLVKRLPVAGTAQLLREPRALGGCLVSEIYLHR